MSTFAALRRSAFGSALLILSLFAFAACDSNGDDELDAEDLDGEYAFSTFEFRPTSTSLPAVNILSRINANSTFLDIRGNDGTFELEYRLPGQNNRFFIEGNIDVDGDEVRLDFNEEDNPEELLLPETLTLQIEGDGASLSAQQMLTGVDLDAFEERLNVPEGERAYDGITSAGGQLVINLSRQGSQ